MIHFIPTEGDKPNILTKGLLPHKCSRIHQYNGTFWTSSATQELGHPFSCLTGPFVVKTPKNFFVILLLMIPTRFQFVYQSLGIFAK